MIFFFFWIGCIVATGAIASKKNRGTAEFVIFAFFFGPIALLVALLMKERPPAVSLGKTSVSSDPKVELELIKRTLDELQKRLAVLEGILNRVPAQGQAVPTSTPVVEPTEEKTAPEAKGKEELEFVFGKYWLNRIGVVVFVLGVAFFIGYTFTYLNAFTKILIGYVFSLAFFIWGNFLERKTRYAKLAWGILGGAWALMYLSAYAMYYIEVTKVITSPVAEMWLLAVTSYAAILYNLKYRSWVVTSITFILAFITAGLGSIDYSTIFYCAILVGSVVFLAVRLQWYEFLLFGIAAAYLTYAYWLYPQILNAFLVTRNLSIPVYEFQLSFGVLSVSWALITIGLFLLRKDTKYVVAGLLMNAAFYSLLSLNILYRLKAKVWITHDIIPEFLFALSAVYFLFAFLYQRIKSGRLLVVSSSIAFSLLAAASMIKFPRLSVGYFWLFEMMLVGTLGIYYKEALYRVLAWMLSIALFLRLFIVDYASGREYVIMGVACKHSVLIFMCAALVYYFLGTLFLRKKIMEDLRGEERSLFRSFIVIGTVFLTGLIWRESPDKWLSSLWALEGAGILAAGFFFKDKTYRICALSVLASACIRLFFIDMAGINTIYKIIAFLLLGALFLGASLVYSKFTLKAKE